MSALLFLLITKYGERKSPETEVNQKCKIKNLIGLIEIFTRQWPSHNGLHSLKVSAIGALQRAAPVALKGPRRRCNPVSDMDVISNL